MAWQRRRSAIWTAVLLFPSIFQGITPDHQSLASPWIFHLVQPAAPDDGESNDRGPSSLALGASWNVKSIALAGARVDGAVHVYCPLGAVAPFKMDPVFLSVLARPAWRGPSAGLPAWLCRFLC